MVYIYRQKRRVFLQIVQSLPHFYASNKINIRGCWKRKCQKQLVTSNSEPFANFVAVTAFRVGACNANTQTNKESISLGEKKQRRQIFLQSFWGHDTDRRDRLKFGSSSYDELSVS